MKVMVLGAGPWLGDRAGFRPSRVPVIVRDIEQSVVDRGLANIGRNLERMTSKGGLTDDDRRAASSPD
jgi:3-hydroxybutyryl-CoA dehydrogenase